PTIVNVYLVRAGDGWTLVDTGMHTGDSRRAMEAALAEHGIAPTDVTRIVCTHHHIDHYGTSGPYRDLTHAQVLLHPLEAEKPDGILFVGDHLLPKITPHVGVYPGGPENPLGDFLNSHEKIKRLEARLVCPAHGGVYEDHRRRASQLIDFHRVRKMTMHDAIRRKPLTPYEVALEAFAISPQNRFQVTA